MLFNLSLLLLRLVLGLIFLGHGAQKLFGFFGGHGRAGTSQFLTSLGFRPAKWWAVVVALGEFLGGLFLALGILTPLAALLIN
jgi:putative oxidoreductase